MKIEANNFFYCSPNHLKFFRSRLIIILLITFFLEGNCQNSNNPWSEYQNQINSWRQNRVKKLKSPEGWLNLIGLYWLKEGENSIGSNPSNEIVINNLLSDNCIANFKLKNHLVFFNSVGNNIFYLNDSLVTNALIFKDEKDESKILKFNSLRMNIIKRGEKLGLRVRDLNSPEIENFKGLDYFDLDSNYRVKATLTNKDSIKELEVLNVLGQYTSTPVAGILEFTINKTIYKLIALDEGEDLFLIFADPTNGFETYGSGRFLYAKKPSNGSLVELDFNKSYNPPCAFTNFATCPKPPKQNFLPIKILAGEKNYNKKD